MKVELIQWRVKNRKLPHDSGELKTENFHMTVAGLHSSQGLDDIYMTQHLTVSCHKIMTCLSSALCVPLLLAAQLLTIAGQGPIGFELPCGTDNLSCPRIGTNLPLECYEWDELCNGEEICDGGSDEGRNITISSLECKQSYNYSDILVHATTQAIPRSHPVPCLYVSQGMRYP